MDLDALLEKYKHVKTGQDLIDLGVIPKTSSARLKIKAHKRLITLRDRIKATVNEEMMGNWKPAFEPQYADSLPEINGDDAKKYARPGMRIRARARLLDDSIDTLEGTILSIDRGKNIFEIKWDARVKNGSNLGGKVEPGFGESVEYTHRTFALLVPEGRVMQGYVLAEGVEAGDKLGHLVRFAGGYKGKVRDPSSNNEVGDVIFPEEYNLTLVKFNASGRVPYVDLKSPGNVVNMGQRRNFRIYLNEDLLQKIEASSLGQYVPKNLEEEIYKETLAYFFPKTSLDTDRARRAIIGILMEKDLVFYGPPGSGKTQLARDIVDIAKQQGVLFVVPGCQVQCSPFSLFDPEFAKVVDACPECKINYSPDFKETGFFKRPKPEDVKVVVMNYTEGRGIEYIQGSPGLQHLHLAGFKMPRLDNTTTEEMEDEASPEGFHPGILPRVNNGVLVFDEMEKCRSQMLDVILDVLQSENIKPEQLRFTYPANSFIVGTANDQTMLSAALNDRLLLLAIRYIDDVDKAYEITRRSYHGEFTPVESVDIGDIHIEQSSILRQRPMPVIIERAVDAFYIKFRNEYSDKGKQEISSSNRSKLDALSAARAELLLDELFFGETPIFATEHYAIRGIQYALCTRVQEREQKEDIAAKIALDAYVEKEFPALLSAEVDTWWCTTYKDIATRDNQLPGLKTNFDTELAGYQADLNLAVDSFNHVRRNVEEPQNPLYELAAYTYPLMARLFKEQPRMRALREDQLLAMIGYFMQTQKVAKCP